MKSKILGLLAAGLLAGPMAARAATVTELFQVTLPYASGVYSAGHVFEITVTYDNAGTAYSQWNDGPNGIAEFGNGDDTLIQTLSLSGSYTLFSDAQISISGLAPLPIGATALDVFNTHVALYSEEGDPSTSGAYQVIFQADDLTFNFYQFGPEAGFTDFLGITQFYRSAEGVNSQQDMYVADFNLISRTAVPAPVPLPAAAWLLLSGLGGLGLLRRRKAA